MELPRVLIELLPKLLYFVTTVHMSLPFLLCINAYEEKKSERRSKGRGEKKISDGVMYWALGGMKNLHIYRCDTGTTKIESA